MRQKQITHLPGRFWPCAECHTELRHIEHYGRTGRETLRSDVPATRHNLECRCGRSTGLCISLESAEADWGRRYSQMPLDLQADSTNRIIHLPHLRPKPKTVRKSMSKTTEASGLSNSAITTVNNVRDILL